MYPKKKGLLFVQLYLFPSIFIIFVLLKIIYFSNISSKLSSLLEISYRSVLEIRL